MSRPTAFAYVLPSELRRRHDAAVGLHKPALAVQGSQTSNQAAAAVEPRRGRLQAVVLAALADSVGGLTAQELETATGLSGNTIRPRIVELCEVGRVVDSGKRRRTASRRWAVVWIVA